MQTIFVSSDNSKRDFDKYFANMSGFLGIRKSDPRQEELSEIYKVNGIPTVVLINGETGDLINPDARDCVQRGAPASEFPWSKAEKKIIRDVNVDDIDGINEKPSLVLLLEHGSEEQRRAALASVLPFINVRVGWIEVFAEGFRLACNLTSCSPLCCTFARSQAARRAREELESRKLSSKSDAVLSNVFVAYSPGRKPTKIRELTRLRETEEGRIQGHCHVCLLDVAQDGYCVPPPEHRNVVSAEVIHELLVSYKTGGLKKFNEERQRPKKLKASPLLVACEEGQMEEVSKLLEEGANINQRGEEGMTPLLVAVEGRRVDVVRALLTAGPLMTRLRTQLTSRDICAWHHQLSLTPRSHNSPSHRCSCDRRDGRPGE